jgi:hypothetical protein
VARFWAPGLGRILQDKWAALMANLQSLVAVQSSIIAFPFALMGAWRRRWRTDFQLAGVYLAALFGAMTLVFTFPGLNGAYFHSGTALLPFVFPAALIGLDASVEAAARRLKHWRPENSKPVFMMLLVAGAIVMTVGRVGAGLVNRAAEKPDVLYEHVGAWLDAAGEQSAVVAVNNPPAFYYLTGRPCIVVPNGDAQTLLAAMAAFGARWAVLDANHPPGLAALYESAASQTHFQLRAEFQDGAGRPAYLFERMP